MQPDTAKLDAALALVRRWHDQRPVTRTELGPEDVRSVRVLGPVQIRLRSLVEERSFDFEAGPPPGGSPAVEDEPTDPWATPVDELHLDAMVQDATDERTRWTTVDTVVRPCGGCEGEGQRTCERCGGDGIDGLESCVECGGVGKRDCRDCRGTARRVVTVRLARRFRFVEAARIHEGDDDEVGPHVLLHLVDHPTPGETLHEQEGPRIERYVGQGSGTSYREAASPMASTAEKLLQSKVGEHDERVVHQWLTVTRIPVYALELSRGRTAYVYGDPPNVSPPRLLRPLWLVLVPFLVAMALLALATWGFFLLVANTGGP
jgi:hypothetical protein